MIASRVLLHSRNAVLHVGHADLRGRRLSGDELAQILQLSTKTDVGAIVEQDKEFEPGVLTLRRNPIRDLVAIMALVYRHIALAYIRYVRAVTSFDRDQQVCRLPLRTCVLRTNAAGDGHPHRKTEYSLE